MKKKFRNEWFWLAIVLSIFFPVIGIGYGIFKIMPGWRQDKRLGVGCIIGAIIGIFVYYFAPKKSL